ncbi:phosphomannomutase/phosphoglucomutase [Pseudomonas psychrotolerans]|nr:phosphomannomutase/phosphoglucomutase [Pseudomonas psychrotolerans]
MLALAGLLLASVVLWFLVLQPQGERNQEQQADQALQAQAASLNQLLVALTRRLQGVAGDALVLQALQGDDPAARTAAETQLRERLGVVDVLVVPAGMRQIDNDRPGPLNYAALDLLKRLESGQRTPPEAYRIGDRWLVYSAQPLRRGDQLLGSVVLVEDLTTVLQGGWATPPANIGHWRLLQQFPGGAVQQLASGGAPGDAALSRRLATGSALWTLELAPATEMNDDLALGAPLVAFAFALFGVLAGFWLVSREMSRRLRDDVRTLAVYAEELDSNQTAKSPALRLAAMEPVAKAMARLAGRPAGSSPDLYATAPSDAVAKTLAEFADRGRPQQSEPLFQTTDILDISILDEDQDLLGLEKPPMSTTPQAPQLNASIFRAYDIRGVVGDSLTAEAAYWIGRAIGSESLARGEPNVAVGRDGRLSGPELVAQLIKGVADSGANVSDVGMVPTPVLYYAANVLEGKSGVMLTGSHNPPDYNGFKIVIAGETLANESIQRLRQRIETGDVASGQGQIQQVDVLKSYADYIRNDVVLAKKLKVVVDAGNGVAAVNAPQLIESLGCEVIPLFCEVDGNFPNHHPDPGKPENLEDLIAKVKETGADLGLAFDGDGDRVGVVTNEGKIIYPDQLLMLFAKDVVSRNPGADIIFDVKCTRRLNNLIAGYGGRPIMWKTGHSLIKKKMKETGALLAGEMSGHVFFKERWFGFDDGIYSAVRLLEILSQEKGSAQQVFDTFPVDISTPEINIQVTEENKFGIIETLQRDAQWGDAQITTLDGVRVDYQNGWGLVRASNTTPVLVLRFEAETLEELERIKTVFRKQLLAVQPDLNLPF